MDMFVELYCHVTSELTYEASVAELEYTLEVTKRGLSLVVEGFSHKLHVRRVWGRGQRSPGKVYLMMEGFCHKYVGVGDRGQGAKVTRQLDQIRHWIEVIRR